MVGKLAKSFSKHWKNGVEIAHYLEGEAMSKENELNTPFI